MQQIKFAIIFLFLCPAIFANSKKEAVLFWSLDPTSLTKQYSFYRLYPESPFGKKALDNVVNLLAKNCPNVDIKKLSFHLPKMNLDPLIQMVNARSDLKETPLSKEQLLFIESLSSHLKHKTLKGHRITKKEDLLDLKPEEIDLSRAILLYEFESKPNPILEIRRYEANLDLMALQVLAKLDKDANEEDKIHAISHFIFHEMQFRFPPHSLYANDIDLYTFLPSVLDSRQGVCLGVSIIYLSLAQRLGLDLEIITPPGHIFVRHNKNGKILNIETTARGIHLPTDVYLGINTKSLQVRNIKEVIGMAFFNKASVYIGRKLFDKALNCYETALTYMPDDDQVKMLLALSYISIGEKEKGNTLLKEVRDVTFDGAIYPDAIPQDLLDKKVSIEAIQTIFEHVDETKSSILRKQSELKDVLKKYPKFRTGLFQLAVTYLQLGRTLEALEVLEKYHEIDPFDPTVNYYMAMLNIKRFQYKKAWEHYKLLNQLLTNHDHNPRPLKNLYVELRLLYPS